MLVNTSKLHFPKEIQIKKLAIAHDSTFILLLRQHPAEKKVPYKTIIHMDRESTIIQQYDFQEDIPNFVMLTSHSLMVPLVKKDSIVCIDLLTKNQTSEPFDFKHHNVQYTPIKVFTFQASSLIAIVQIENGTFDGCGQTLYYTTVHLSYMNKEEPWKVIAEYSKFGYENLQPSSFTSQANHHSLVIMRAGGYYILCQLDQYQDKYNIITRQVRLPSSDAYNRMYFSSQKILYQKSDFRCFFNQKGKNGICTYTIKEEERFLKLEKVKNDEVMLPIKGQVEAVFVENYTCVKKIQKNTRKQQGKIVLFWVNIESRKVEHELPLEGGYYWILDFEQFKKSDIVALGIQDDKRDTFLVKEIVMLLSKEVYMHFLLHLNEDFDDDLLMDAVELLESQL